MRRILFALALIGACLPLAWAQEPAAPPKTKVPDQAALDKQLETMLNDVTLVGFFTRTDQKDMKNLKEERYTITKVSKIQGDVWLFQVRIQYGGKDATIPLPLEMKWAGDTPMITLTNAPVPGFGTFTSRVLLYDDHYAGYWSGGGHGGHLFGKIEKNAK